MVRVYDKECNKTNVDMFGDDEKVLEELNDERVFKIHYREDVEKWFIVEQCDEYFIKELTYSDCKSLARIFEGIAEKIKQQ